MPGAQDGANWDNPPLFKAPEGVSPRVSTVASKRDGSRPVGPNPPTFTLSATSTSITATITEGNGAESYEIRVDSGTAVSGLTVSGLTAEQTYAVQVRGIDGTGTGEWSEAVNQATSAESEGVIFTENFDDQPDFTSRMHSTSQAQYANLGDTVPVDWYGLYQSHHYGHDSIEILSSNSDKARGGTGKSMVNWRESYITGGGYAFNSDSQLIKYLGQEYDELYVEFWISFSDNWWHRTISNTGNWQSKIVRIGSWSGSGDIESGINGDIGPLFIWDYKRDQYGCINFHTLRGGPWGANYTFNGAYQSEHSWGYTFRTAGMAVEGGDPQVLDQVNGGYLVNAADPTSHDQVFGPAGHWTKMGIYVKKNSAIDAQDGIASIYMNDQRIRHHSTVPWVQGNGTGLHPGFNYFSIGGNDLFSPEPNDSQFEDWYAIDDVVCYASLPEELR